MLASVNVLVACCRPFRGGLIRGVVSHGLAPWALFFGRFAAWVNRHFPVLW
jgi:hypothetical protein